MKRIVAILFLFLTITCTRKKAIDIELPTYFGRLVVECYLIPGEKYKLALYESVSYLDDPRLPIVYDAEVMITRNGDTTRFFNSVVERTDTEIGYNYLSNKRVPADYDNTFYLYVKDPKGRVLTSSCKLVYPVTPTNLSYQTNSTGDAYLTATLNDQPGTNYYRIFADQNRLSWETMKWEQRMDDIGKDDKPLEVYSPYVFKTGDSVIVTFATLEKTYYDFLNTLNDVQVSAADPFSQPGKVASNINGGLGIFASYNYTRQTLYIK